MIEAWYDDDSGEAFFCLPNMIDLHIKSKTVSRNIRKIRDLPTDSMTEAHKIFLEDMSNQVQEDEAPLEGWD